MAIYGPSDLAPTLPTDQGYFVTFPPKAVATEAHHTAELKRPDGGTFYLWVYNVEQNYEISGQYAQSHRHRAWYPRNFVQPRITVQGQFPNQSEYGKFAEWVRDAQMQCQRANSSDYPRGNTIHLTIHTGNPAEKLSKVHTRYKHDGLAVRGHIMHVDRQAERWVNAPEFQFEFVVVSATWGVLTVGLTDPTLQLNKIAMAMQFPNETRPKSWETERGRVGHVSFVVDPDIILTEQKEARAKAAEAAAKKEAELDAAAASSGTGGVVPGVGDVPVSGEGVASVLAEAKRISAQDLPYFWGGGHGKIGVPSGSPAGFDCSGYVSACLGAGGYLKTPMDSGALAGWGRAGPGRDFTVYANDGHAYLVFENGSGGDVKRADTSPQSGDSNQSKGPHTRDHTRNNAGFTARHA